MPGSPSPLLTCQSVSLTRGNRLILDSLDLDLHGGSLTALLGPNGAGKSSLLKCLTGELAYEGSISLFGRERQGWAGDALAHRVGVLPQSSSLSFPFLCEEVVAMGRLPHSEPASRRDQIVRAAMTHAGVEHLAGRLYPGLSGGERQRVAIARAMMKNAPIVILDEATSYTDPENEAVLQDAIGRLTRGKTLIVIAHRLSTITDADQIAVVEQGKILDAGTHDELLKRCPLYAQMWAAHTQAKDADRREGGGKHV